MGDKNGFYKDTIEMVESVLSKERNYIANMANLSSIMFHELNAFKKDSINWFGFYLVDKKTGNELHLGPFHGKVACTRIKFEKGVCGKCITEQKSVIVDNVHEFKGHIACDSASNSEICVPIFHNGKIYGLLDVDSVNFSNFDQVDQEALEKLARVLEKSSDFE
jgi:L-methionine (R)-S-oxide reductase